MNYLLDTHALLWWLDDSPQLSENARDIIASGKNLIFLSSVVIWEIRIKQALGKLEVPHDFEKVLKGQRFENLPITAEHAHAIATLPGFHQDPFDRMLIAQSKMESFVLISNDGIFGMYDVKLVW